MLSARMESRYAGMMKFSDSSFIFPHTILHVCFVSLSVVRAISENTIITHLDLSYNNLSSAAGANIFEALRYNQTIRSLNLSGNLLDDICNTQLGDMLTENDVLIELILNHNKLGYACGVSISEALVKNRSLKILDLGNLC